jgi:hypothetical protein
MSIAKILVVIALLAGLEACQASAPYDTPCATQKDDTSCLWHDYGGGESP